MSPHDSTLELLINKSLDGEISPTEQHELNERLERDALARALFDEMRSLHNQCHRAVTQGILEVGETPETILQAARRRAAVAPPEPGRFTRFLKSQFASGLAAGLLLATLLMTWFDPGQGPRSAPISSNFTQGDAQDVLRPEPPTSIRVGTGMQRRQDVYFYTDEYGRIWRIDGEREDSVQPMVERNDY